MPLTLNDKKALAAEVNEVAERAYAAVAAEYRGLTVAQMTELRRKAREIGVFLKVVKNTVARKALEGTSFDCMRGGLTGPLLLAFSLEDPGSSARLILEFSKSNDKLVARSVAIGGQVFSAIDLERISKLPTKDEALSTLMATMKAPVEKLVRTLAEPTAKLARVIVAIKDQKVAA